MAVFEKPALGDIISDPSHVLTKNLLAIYPFVDSGTTLTDFSGNGHDGSLINLAASPWLSLKQGSLGFNGVGYVDLGNISSNLFSGDFTLIAEVFITNPVIPTEFIFGKEINASSGLAWFSRSTQATYEARIDGSQASLGVNNDAVDGVWQRVVLTRNNGVVTSYVDKVLKSTQSSALDGSSTAFACIGATTWSSSLRWSGRVSDFRIYNRGFNSSDVALDFADPWVFYGKIPEAFAISVGPSNVTAYIDWDEPLTISEDVTAVPVLTLSIFNRLSDTLALPAPVAYQEVRVSLKKSMAFGGVITAVSPVRLAGNILRYNITATGYYRTLDYVDVFRENFISQSAGAIIRALVAKYAPWISAKTGFVQDGPVISQFSIRNRKMSDILLELSTDSGFVVFVDDLKNLIFKSKEEHVASLQVTDAATTYDFTSMEVTPDFSQVINVVKVVGGLQKGASITENLTGNAVANFNLTFPVFGVDKAVLLFEEFTSTSFSANLSETDVSNPTPPPNFVESDGYIFPALQRLQVVGGPGTFGSVGLTSLQTFARKEFREFSVEEILITTVSEGVICSLLDGAGLSQSNVREGFCFTASGDIDVIAGGSIVTLVDYKNTAQPPALINTNPTYQAGKTYSVMLQTYKTGAETGEIPWGVKFYIQGGTAPNYGTVGGRLWSLLYDHSYTADPPEFSIFGAVLSNNLEVTLPRIRITDSVPVSVTVAGVSKNVGLEIDIGTKSDCFIDANSIPNRLRFYFDTTPGDAVPITVTYNRAEDTLVRRRDEDSINRIKNFSELIGDTGERHGSVTPGFEAKTIDDLLRVASNYLKEFSREKYTGHLTTFTPLLSIDSDPPRVGQILNLNLPSQGIGPVDVVISQVNQTFAQSDYKDGALLTGPIIQYDLNFSDVDSYLDFLLETQRKKRTIIKQVSGGQFVDVVDISSVFKVSSSTVTTQKFVSVRAVIGEAIVGLVNIGEVT